MHPFELTRRLIEIESITENEKSVALFLRDYLRGLSYDVSLQEAAPERFNVVAFAGKPDLVFATHIDTVPPYLPFHEDEEYLYGRGACDAKGIAAAQIAAAERLRADGVEELGLLFVVDEEQGSIGARVANRHPLARECRWLNDAAPTENKLAVGSKGSLRLTLRTDGTGGHSAAPVGRSAIDALLAVLADVQAAPWPRGDYFGETTCNNGGIARRAAG